jgi:hypothetical protein
MTKITLKVEGLGHVPAMKNNKMLTSGKLITNPKRQKWMKLCQASFESQLISLYQTSAEGMQMGRSLRSWIALHIPLDDAVSQIPEIYVTSHQVPKGQEGAVITIERI